MRTEWRYNEVVNGENSWIFPFKKLWFSSSLC
jgi:hypothetical protein